MNNFPAMTEAQRAEIIADCEADIALAKAYIAFHGETPELLRKLKRQQIALAALTAEPDHYVFHHPAGKLLNYLASDECKGQEHVVAGYTAPPAPVLRVPDDYFAKLVQEARLRADKAIRKFPQPNYVLNKVAEESGEVIKAVIHYTEGREDWLNVEGELIDNLAMLIRLVKEGDQVIGFSPPDFVKGLITTGGQQ